MKAEKHTHSDKNKGVIPSDKMKSENSMDKSARQPLGVKPLLKEEEEKFEMVKDYILAHPSASVAEISEVHDISPIKIFDWIRDERLEFSDNAEFAWFSCQSCGAKIKSGRLCNRCKMTR
jgi:hypothetical protein